MTAILKLLRRVFLIVLILSILLIISLALFPSYFFPLQSYPPPPSADLAPEIAIFVSISTAVISFLGFVNNYLSSTRIARGEGVGIGIKEKRA
jgi:Na+-driven multidrug efflux pump